MELYVFRGNGPLTKNKKYWKHELNLDKENRWICLRKQEKQSVISDPIEKRIHKLIKRVQG